MFYDIIDPVGWPNGLLLSQIKTTDEHKRGLTNANHGWSSTFGSNGTFFPPARRRNPSGCKTILR